MTADAPDLRDKAVDVFRAAVDAVEPGRLVCRALADLPSSIRSVLRGEHPTAGRVHCIGIGKAAGPMALALEDALGDVLAGGVAVTPRGFGVKLRKVRPLEAGHPLPDEAGVRAAQAVVETIERAGGRDVLVVLVSGGGSALLPAPAAGLTLADLRDTAARLLDCGARIDEVNAVRKHISALAGGGLVREAARVGGVIALAISDVPHDRLDVVASGPTVPDPTTFADALEVLRRYAILDRVPQAVRRHVERGARGLVPETPKPGDPLFARTRTVLVGSNRLALDAAADRAHDLGMRPLVVGDPFEGEARLVGRELARGLLSFRSLAPACLLTGGETTVTVRPGTGGVGGRNQEVALAAAQELRGAPRVAFLAGGTDGEDGPTDAAGAVVDGATAIEAERSGLSIRDALARNDSYRFFERLGWGHVKTGPTLTNVMDVVVGVVSPGP